MLPTPDCESVAPSVTETGAVLYQPVEHAPPLQLAVVVGAVESAVTVKLVGLDVRFALFVAVTLFGSAGSVAPVAKL